MKRFWPWLPAIVWMIVIFLLSSRQSVSVSTNYWLNFLFFKTLHVIEYAILYVFYFRAMKSTYMGKNVVIPYAIAFILTILYAITDEIHQTTVPTREGKLRDVIIDGIGASIAWIFIAQLLPKAPKKLRQWGRSWLAAGQK